MREWYEVVQALARLGKNATDIAFKKASSALQIYFSFLGRVSLAFLMFLAFAAVLFIFGAAFEFRPAISFATFIGGMAAFLWLLAAFPIVWAVQKGMEWESVRKTFEWIGVAALWVFFLSIYFYLVPVPAVALPLVLVVAAAIAIASVLFGVGISTRFLALRLGIVFTVMTVFFVMTALFPNSFGGLGKLVAWADDKMGGAVEEVVMPLPTAVAYGPDLVFFDPRTKEPKVWYYQISENPWVIELYDAPGFHWRYQTKLEPITPELVRKLEEMEKSVKAKIEADLMAAEQKKAEEQRLATLERAVKDTQAKAAEATKAAKAQGPAGPPGPAGLPGPQGAPGQPGRDAVIPESRLVTIPSGTELEVVLDQRLSTENNRAGDLFRASLGRAVAVDGSVVFPVGTELTGRISELQRPGKVKGVASLALTLTAVSFEDASIPVQTDSVKIGGEGSAAKDATKIGIGAGIGAVVGAIFGGKEGAAAGAALGGGATTAETLATRGKEIELKPEQKFVFRLAKDLTFEVR
ncbi:MAG: hypothetical protein AAB627_02050 [Patescibacteria group bacterium]